MTKKQTNKHTNKKPLRDKVGNHPHNYSVKFLHSIIVFVDDLLCVKHREVRDGQKDHNLAGDR